MNKTKIIFGIGIVLAVLAVFTVPAMAYNVMYFVPQESSCGPGENVTVWVMLNTSHSDVGGFGANIAFNTAVVNITKIEEGIDPCDWDQWGWSNWGDHVTFSGLEFGGTGPGVLQLGKMTLKCINPGTSSLNFQKLFAPEDPTSVSDIYGDVYPDFTVINGTFTCLSPPETYSTYLEVLHPEVGDWHLISLPLTATDMTVANIIDTSLGTLGTNYDALYKYDASAHNFVPQSSTDVMENGVGYFIHMKSNATWTYTGSAYIDMSAPLTTGLNMVGWLNCSKAVSSTSLDSSSNVSYIARWNATSQSYETYNPAAPDPYTPGGFNDFFDMDRGTGYFISAKEGYTALSEKC